MKSLTIKSLATLSVLTLMAGSAFAQSTAQSADKTQPVTAKPDRTTADPATRKAMQEKRAILRKQRNECIKQRRAEKIPLTQRTQFINACMAKKAG